MGAQPLEAFHNTSSGTRLHYESCGPVNGPLLVLLHGLGGSTTTYSPLLPRLPQDKYRTVSVDFEGQGKTPLSSPKAQLSIRRYVRDLEDLITALQGQCTNRAQEGAGTILIGHSLGSIVALHYAAMHPSTVDGLALLGVGRSASHIPEARQRMLDMAARARKEGIQPLAELAAKTNFPAGEETPQWQRNEVKKLVGATDPEGYARTCEAVVDVDHNDPEYALITCPTVLISGESDPLSPVARALELRGLLGGETEVRVVQGGHQPILSDLEGVVGALEWLFQRAGSM